MYFSRPGLILGFHGCDESTVDDVVHKGNPLKVKQNTYDWLGHGAYFWENSPSRALEYAESLSKTSRGSSIKKPAVLGAIIDLGHCLDLLGYRNLAALKTAYEILKEAYEKSGFQLPENKIPKGGENDLLLRELDCVVIETLHKLNDEEKLRPFDSIRGVFWEGMPISECWFSRKGSYPDLHSQSKLYQRLFPASKNR